MQITAEKFLEEVKDHQVKILKDDGLYRHLLVKQPNTICQSFNIVTTPNHLFYYGDMGSFSFSRTEDMFRFFRDDTLRINEGYWAEKLQSVDRCSGYRQFSFELFKSNLMEYCQTDEQKIFMEDQLEYCDEDEYGAMEFYRSFDCSNSHGITLDDFWEYTHNQPSHRYLWCCYALVWAIQEYDKLITQK